MIKHSDSSNKQDFLLVALTGGIASGKSIVATTLQSPEVLVIDADSLARDAVNHSPNILGSIVKEFGSEVLDSEGKLNRGKMAELVFSDHQSKKKLEAIIHPEVKRLLTELLKAIPSKVKIVIYVVPLLVEAKIDLKKFDLIVSVLTEPQIALERTILRDQCTKELAQKKIESQARNEEKIKVSDYLIYNNGTREELCDNISQFRIYLNHKLTQFRSKKDLP